MSFIFLVRLNLPANKTLGYDMLQWNWRICTARFWMLL